MVEEPQSVGEDEEQADAPPPPPARPLQRRLTREAPSHPPPHPPQNSMSDSISSQWELPSIPSGGLGSDLSMSWTETEDLTATMMLPAHAPPPAPSESTSTTHTQHLSPEELTAIWKRVGVQICEAATLLYEKSKKAVVGDGTYAGFVNAALSEVPNAAKSGAGRGWGCLVYAQTGAAVQKRLSEIMTGDVVELVDARFKGHKGLQTYSQHVGTAGEALVGVVSEVEQKKSKVKVLQANQHVGQQTVESVSYRLEDLKSGTVKVRGWLAILFMLNCCAGLSHFGSLGLYTIRADQRAL
jgi:myosin tail region-interacting protein MTI1